MPSTRRGPHPPSVNNLEQYVACGHIFSESLYLGHGLTVSAHLHSPKLAGLFQTHPPPDPLCSLGWPILVGTSLKLFGAFAQDGVRSMHFCGLAKPLINSCRSILCRSLTDSGLPLAGGKESSISSFHEAHFCGYNRAAYATVLSSLSKTCGSTPTPVKSLG